ncbi:MAG: class I SAM-dependent methyltransferase [Candidatus Babeliales bacterium]|nr:class I SAM-dependent methyltransferase [Candidatus Babeliales bacterium]
MSKTLKTYSKLSTEYYDLENHINHDIALAFYIDYAKQANGLILEPMCGSGRFLIPMLQLGLQAFGFDASHYMIDAFKQNYSKISMQAPVWQSFIEDFNDNKLYKLIFIPYGSWGLIIDQVIAKQSCKIIYNHLAVGGKFVLEIETVSSVPKNCGILHKNKLKRADGSSISLTTIPTYDAQTQIFKCECRYESIINQNIVDTEFEEFKQYLYKFDEFDQILYAAGFTNIKKFQSFQKEPATDINARILIYECIKL